MCAAELQKPRSIFAGLSGRWRRRVGAGHGTRSTDVAGHLVSNGVSREVRVVKDQRLSLALWEVNLELVPEPFWFRARFALSELIQPAALLSLSLVDQAPMPQ
jgi:hypothetical protein